MAFWSGERIKDELKKIIFNERDEPIGDEKNIHCNSYYLTIGPEVYVTKELKESRDEIKTELDKDGRFTIAPAQFAVILSQEFIKIPKNCFGMISMCFNHKSKGLINVSGFNVDPGWDGRLILTVYNAGPHALTFRRGDNIYQIWFADLDRESDKYSHKGRSNNPRQVKITSDFLNELVGSNLSPSTLNERIKSIEIKISEFEINRNRWLVGIFFAFLIGCFFTILIPNILSKSNDNDIFDIDVKMPSKNDEAINIETHKPEKK